MRRFDLVQLRTQWDDLMALFDVAANRSDAVFGELVVKYEEDGRFYHTLAHIQNVLEVIQSLSSYAQDLPAIQLAAWFHDAIYDPRAADNERQSAQYAARALDYLGIPTATSATVQRLIQATTHRPPYPDDIDCQILLDADLATFASDHTLQVWIEEAIRQEYAFVPETAYRKGRRRILQQFLQRERIYYTEPMAATLEKQARQNITNAIAWLK